jgi:hypothetical protein
MEEGLVFLALATKGQRSPNQGDNQKCSDTFPNINFQVQESSFHNSSVCRSTTVQALLFGLLFVGLLRPGLAYLPLGLPLQVFSLEA